MQGAAQRRRQLGIDAVTVEEDLVVARGGRLTVVAVGRAVILRSRGSGYGQQRDVAQVPVTLVRVGESVDHRILVLVTRAAVELGDGTRLHQGIR